MALRRKHWESVYQTRDDELVGWYQAHPARSLSLLQECKVQTDAPIIDIGGGSSRLVDHLLDAGHTDVTVLDISGTALAIARKRLGRRSETVKWIEADATEYEFARKYQVWHDRAAFHFLTDAASQARYVDRLRQAIPDRGHVIIATFAADGPEACSGLPVQRYGERLLSETLGAGFRAERFDSEAHRTPAGSTQEFLYGYFRRRVG